MYKRIWLWALFALLLAPASAQNLSLNAAEYFWDTDPGQGSGIALPAADGNIDSAVELLRSGVIVTPPLAGAQTLNVGVRGRGGAWGPVFSSLG